MAGCLRSGRRGRDPCGVVAALFGALLLAGCGPGNWPPHVGLAYPDREFVNYDGRTVRVSDFKGKVVLVEPIGMNCPACNAFAGAGRKGGFEGLKPQQGLQSIERYLGDYAGGARLGYELVLIHLLLYDFTMQAPEEIT